MSAGENNLAFEWLQVASDKVPHSSFAIPRLVDFEDRLAEREGHYVLIEEVRRNRFKARQTKCRPANSASNYMAPVPGFLDSSQDFLLQEEYSTLLHHPCGAEVISHYCRNGVPIKTLNYTALPLLDEHFKPRYLVLQAGEVRVPKARAGLAATQKPHRYIGGQPCKINPNGFEYEVREYLDIGWGIPRLCTGCAPCGPRCAG